MLSPLYLVSFSPKERTYRLAINIFLKWGFPSTTGSNPLVTGKMELSIVVAPADVVAQLREEV
jgi:hypothetical protein